MLAVSPAPEYQTFANYMNLIYLKANDVIVPSFFSDPGNDTQTIKNFFVKGHTCFLDPFWSCDGRKVIKWAPRFETLIDLY